MAWPLSCLISQQLFPLWIALIAFLSMMRLCPCFAKCFAILHWDVLDAWYLQKLLLLSKTCPFASNCFQSWPLPAVEMSWFKWMLGSDHTFTVFFFFFFFPYQVHLLFWTVLLNLLGFLFCSALVYYQWLAEVFNEIRRFSLYFAAAPQRTARRHWRSTGTYLCKDVPVHLCNQHPTREITPSRGFQCHFWEIYFDACELGCCWTISGSPILWSALPDITTPVPWQLALRFGFKVRTKKGSVSMNMCTDRLLEIHYEDTNT